MKLNSRSRYKLDTNDLLFKKEKVSFIEKLKGAYKFFFIGLAVALGFWLFLQFEIVSSPSVSIIESENNKIVENLSNLNSKFDSLANLLSITQKRDDNIYRVVSETPPLSTSQRTAGFGGVDKYKSLVGYMNSELMIATAQKSDILLKQLEVQSQSYDIVINSLKEKKDSLDVIPTIAPVAPYDYIRISDRFGMRIHPITREVKTHTGVDFAANIGTPIHSTGNGKVKKVVISRIGYGNQVLIDHGYGFETRYAHMHSIIVKEGETIKRGQKIGTIGNTGRSTGPHLHYEVIYNNEYKNPEHYYINDLTNKEYNSIVLLFCKK